MTQKSVAAATVALMALALPAKAEVVIANRLRDGFTVFLGADGAWVQAIDHGAVARDAAQAAALLQEAEAAVLADLVLLLAPLHDARLADEALEGLREYRAGFRPVG